MSQELIARTDLNQRVKGALRTKRIPGDAHHRRGPEPTYSVTLKLVQSPKFEQLWLAANRASHNQLVAVLTGSTTGSVSTKSGRITIDLSQVELTAKKDLDAKGITVFDKVPAVKGLNFVLFSRTTWSGSSGWSTSSTSSPSFSRSSRCCASPRPSCSLATGRRGLVRATAGLALSMALILVLIAVGRNQYIAGVHPPQSPEASAAGDRHGHAATLRDTVRTTSSSRPWSPSAHCWPATPACRPRSATRGSPGG